MNQNTLFLVRKRLSGRPTNDMGEVNCRALVSDEYKYVHTMMTIINLLLGSLSENDLQEVQKELWKVRSNWYNFGLEIKMEPSDLDAIMQTCKEKSNECFRSLLSSWLKRADPKPTWNVVVTALRAETVNYGQLADTIEQKYTTQSSKITAAHAESDELHNQALNSEDNFRCPCGKCDLDSYLDKGCPKTTSQSYPYLELSKLNEDDKEDLIQKLSSDTANIIECFADLITNTSKSLRSRNVEVSTLVSTSLNLGAYRSDRVQKPLLADHEDQLLKADSIEKVFIILRRHMSFFNYEILAYVIRNLGNDCDKENLKQYNEQFQMFCKRKVFEVSPTVFAPSTDRKRCKLFIVLVTEDTIKLLGDVKASQRNIATLLGVKSSALKLYQIDKASIILVFSVPLFIAQQIFPLKSSICEQLKSKGFTVIVPVSKPQLHIGPIEVKLCE